MQRLTESCSKAGEDCLNSREDFPDVDLKVVKTIQMHADCRGCLDTGEEYKDVDYRLSRCS